MNWQRRELCSTGYLPVLCYKPSFLSSSSARTLLPFHSPPCHSSPILPLFVHSFCPGLQDLTPFLVTCEARVPPTCLLHGVRGAPSLPRASQKHSSNGVPGSEALPCPPPPSPGSQHSSSTALSTVLSAGQRWFSEEAAPLPVSQCERAQLKSGNSQSSLRQSLSVCGGFTYNVVFCSSCVSYLGYIMKLICLECSQTTVSLVPHEWPGPAWKLRAWISGNPKGHPHRVQQKSWPSPPSSVLPGS